MEDPKITTTNQNEIICKNCAAKLTFAPGTNSLKCEYCGTVNEIEIDTEKLEEATRELDYLSFIESKINVSAMQEIHTVKCGGCGAEQTFDNNVVSSSCAFCGSPLVAKQAETQSIIKPTAILPFKIDQRKSLELFRKWIDGLWWAPSGLKQFARHANGLQGMYIPYWTYDARTSTDYTGQRGDDYQEEEEYTNDKGERETRTVTKTNWSFASGNVRNEFDDLFVVGSKSLPESYMDRLEPWNLAELVPYDDKYLAGFKTETYQVDVKNGFERAQEKMEPEIESTIRSDIGGDRQVIESKDIEYSDITFKHILLPVWISAYRFNNKAYRFMINGQTGEVQGERPYSWFKITMAILLVVIVIGLLYYFFGGSK